MKLSIKVIIPVIILVIIEIVIFDKFAKEYYVEEIQTITAEQALNLAHQYNDFRAYYTDNIVNKVMKSSDIKIDSSYKQDDNTIPLPATMMHDLSKIMSKDTDGIQVRLYSDYPFPNNKNTTLDNFEKSALEYFRRTKDTTPQVEHQNYNGKDVVRVAIPDMMNQQSCVTCHNTRVDTPKNDWKLGDIRGALEVIIPIHTYNSNTLKLLEYNNLSLILSGLFFAIFFYFIVRTLETKNDNQLKRIENDTKVLHKSLQGYSDHVIASNADLRGIITYASEALCKISGYTQEELMGQPHSILRHPDTPSSLYKELWDTIQAGKQWQGEIKNGKKDGGHYWVRAIISPEFDSAGEITGYSSTRHDITADKAKEQFMANMSHELRTPLNAIIGFSSILHRKQKDESLMKLTKQISTSSKSLLLIINDILDLSKIQDSKFTIEPYQFNAYTEITNQLEQFDALSTQKKLNIKNKIDQNLNSNFFADWQRISQIILNLISNAIKFTPENGDINYEVSYVDKNLVLKISDNGIGMSPQVQDKIFEPFKQADGSTTRKYGGTGLGLSITQALVERMKGSIALDSIEGKGTTFTVRIPIQHLNGDESTIIDEEAVTNKENTLSGHVLIAEDNKTNQMLLTMLLNEFGVTCDVANDGLEALEIYDPRKHSLVLMDENMPNMGGLGAMKALRDKYKDECGPIIAVTANTMQGDKEKFIRLGMDAYLSKPIDDDKLYSILKKFL